MITIGFLYWLLLILAAILGFWPCSEGPNGKWFGWGRGVLTFVLFCLIGLKLWGWPISG